MKCVFLRLLAFLAVVLLAGCSTYNQRFAQASRADVKHLLYEGAYSGRWASAQASSMGGKLQCILTKLENPACGRGAGDTYRAEFHATWHGLSSTHTVLLHTKPAVRRGFNKGALEFEGTSALHTIIGAGTYSCKGVMGMHDPRSDPPSLTASLISSERRFPSWFMRACYDSTYDKGTFEMSRVSAQPAR